MRESRQKQANQSVPLRRGFPTIGRPHLALVVIGCWIAPFSIVHAAEPPPTKPAAWTQKMRALLTTLEDLLIDVSSDERFQAKKNFKRIEAHAAKLASLAHGLRDGDAPSDPSLKIIAGLFETESKNAYQTLKSGNRTYARDLLRSMTGYCIACHTRNGSGPQFALGQSADGKGVNPQLASLKPLERADFFAATRQFDRALEEYERLISEQGSVVNRAFDWERAVRSSLALSIRVKADPARALAIVNRTLDTPQAPFFLKEQARVWKQTLEKWSSEPTRKAQTEEGLYSEAQRLITEARAVQKYPADRSADMLYLRANRVVHDLLSQYPTGRRVSDALYLAGLSYDVLQGITLWDTHEYYYLACIELTPHSEIAVNCYRRYEESIYLGYTGSGGSFLPAQVKQRLGALEKLARPESGAPSIQSIQR